MMRKLIDLLYEGGYSCVVAKGSDIRLFQRRGVADLYDLLHEDSGFLNGALVADKVIGKGAAALMIGGGVAEIYADLVSESALALFTEAGIGVEYVRSVHHIENRDKTDWCPLEKSCIGIDSIQDILPIIDNFVSKIRGNS